MSDEQLIEYVKRCNELRSSAQAKNKALRKESEEVHGMKPETKRKSKKDVSQDTIAQAMKLLLGQ